MGTVVSLACREGFLQAFLYPSTQAETSVPSGGAGQGHMPRACYPASPPKSGCFTCRAWIQRSCSPVNHVLSFSHHPKNFAFIFVGGPTFTATSHLFHRSNITASAWQYPSCDCSEKQHVSCSGDRYQPSPVLGTHTQLLILSLACIQSSDCKCLTTITWKNP